MRECVSERVCECQCVCVCMCMCMCMCVHVRACVRASVTCVCMCECLYTHTYFINYTGLYTKYYTTVTIIPKSLMHKLTYKKAMQRESIQGSQPISKNDETGFEPAIYYVYKTALLSSIVPLVLKACIHEVEISRASLEWCRILGIVVQFRQSNTANPTHIIKTLLRVPILQDSTCIIPTDKVLNT